MTYSLHATKPRLDARAAVSYTRATSSTVSPLRGQPMPKRLLGLGAASYLFALATTASAEQFVPPFGLLYSEDARGVIDALFVECSLSAKPRRLVCRFSQVFLGPKLGQPQLREELDKLKKGLLEASSEEFAEVKTSMCQQAGWLTEALNRKDFSEAQAAFLRGYAERQKRFCAKPTRENAEALLKSIVEWESRLCALFVYAYEETFEPQGPRRWVSNSGPDGLCGVINISVFEQEDKHPTLWTYENRKVVTNKEGKGMIPCKDLVETPARYGWKRQPRKLTCDIVE